MNTMQHEQALPNENLRDFPTKVFNFTKSIHISNRHT